MRIPFALSVLVGLGAALTPAVAHAQPAPVGDEVIVDSGLAVPVCPAIAARPEGDALLVWERTLAVPAETAVVARAIDADGALGPLAVLDDALEQFPHLAPAVVAAGSGYVATWRYPGGVGRPLPSGQRPNRFARLDSTGVPLAVRRVNPGHASVSPRPSGGFVAIALTRHGRALTLQLVDASGRRVSTPREIVRRSRAELDVAGVFHLPDRGFTVTWVENVRGHLTGVGAQAFDAAGRPLGAVADLLPTATFEYSAIRLDRGIDGTLAVASRDSLGTVLRIYDRRFTRIAGPLLLDATLATPLALAVAPDGRVLVVGRELPGPPSQLSARLFSPTGEALGAVFAVPSTSGEQPPTHCASAAWTPAGWVVAWARAPAPFQPFELVARRFAAE